MATSPLAQFQFFSSLPYELRLKIYGMILNDTRTVQINCEKATIISTRRRYLKSFKSPTPIPSLLHICQETRAEALAHYKPLFCTQYSPSYIYINFTTDIIKLADGIIPYLDGEERDGIRKMELVVSDMAYFGHYNLEAISKMRGLQELELEALGEDLNSWQPEGHYLSTIMKELKEMRREKPDWCCPRVRLVHGRLGKEFGVVEGGIWTEADEED
ncbi:hypothetical protein BCON_0204g00050 [Botryotinia convoluta]|uniref:2EXR domain-containing protein n=1 Tax=Botryotinia convoluta TaxID=54673 RepID=A0A4Z1HL89_9HELO|nr:hypothetical protein BCON_0204g00050 [Botryotinia convoluta]